MSNAERVARRRELAFFRWHMLACHGPTSAAQAAFSWLAGWDRKHLEVELGVDDE